jgi:hypothetical protein
MEVIRQEDVMKRFRVFLLPAVVALCLSVSSPKAAAQITVSIGVAPVCPYGYFNYAPYQCAPFGYYGPQWFTGGIFIGAGPWFRGPVGFHGYINHDYDPHFGYQGPFPVRGERADWGRHRGWEHQFRGNEYRDEVRHDNGNHYGQYKDHGDHGNGKGHDRDDRDHGHDDHGHGHGHNR